MAASEIQIFSRMGCKMNDYRDALPAMTRYLTGALNWRPPASQGLDETSALCGQLSSNQRNKCNCLLRFLQEAFFRFF